MSVCDTNLLCSFPSSSSRAICTALHPLGAGSEPSNKIFLAGIAFGFPPPSHPGACQGLAEEAPGGSQCSPVAQDGALQGRWQAGDAQGTGSCGFGAFGGFEVK